ncbi:hypothetical protein E1180_18320 [Roseibium denhamense]|uniref:Site-specific recombinase XerD n=1 Tax=Roseibium denhamense TaxID=76305 RepID=A0ABY1PA36_9HYPH|nr:DUF6538 domain-containing protein [Roseibium denhamense]MTI07460.1 hypothetical protein [Roseibium denhamense]SMP29914.1 Site-specific recombinase XerD [Roseibium denhamense]
MTNYLLRKNGTFYAVLDVPADVRDKIGKTKFKRSLKTGNRQEALGEVGQVISGWKSEIEVARGNGSIAEEAAVWASMRSKAQDIEELNLIEELMADHAYDIEASGRSISPANGRDPETTKSEDALRFTKLALGKLTPLMRHVDRWLADQSVSEFTEYEYRRELVGLEKRFKQIEDVTRRAASDYIEELKHGGRSRDTIGKRLSAYKGYWDWLARHDYISDEVKNPWQGLMPKKKQVSASLKRRAIPDQVGSELLSSIKANQKRQPDDYAVMLTMAATGMRLGEVASLKKEDVRTDAAVTWLDVKDSKTLAGIRRVPISDLHVRSVLRNKAEQVQPGEYIFQSLKTDERGKRTHQISKRFGIALRRISDDERIVASHSWRYRARTLLERGGVYVATSDWLIGHERPGEGLGRYSEGPSDDQLIDGARHIFVPEHS